MNEKQQRVIVSSGTSGESGLVTFNKAFTQNLESFFCTIEEKVKFLNIILCQWQFSR